MENVRTFIEINNTVEMNIILYMSIMIGKVKAVELIVINDHSITMLVSSEFMVSVMIIDAMKASVIKWGV